MSHKVCPEMFSTIDAASHQNQQPTDLSKNQIECRICLEESTPLIMPCKCDGTVKYVHEQCLKQWAAEIIKKKLKEQNQDGTFQEQTEIECELCKQTIPLQVQWKNIWMSFQEAKQQMEQFFWPLFIVNVLIVAICFTGLVFILVLSILVLSKYENIYYQKYQTDPYYMWGTTAAIFLMGLIFLYKSLKDLHHMFVKRQFLINGIVSAKNTNNTKLISQQIKKNNFQPIQFLNQLQFQSHLPPLKDTKTKTNNKNIAINIAQEQLSKQNIIFNAGLYSAGRPCFSQSLDQTPMAVVKNQSQIQFNS